ncbi:hypothetical protein WA026_001388 [Henosepilachna vigintioctopunctata]|uniref:Uncharacterized protein n=1 Tax=Henosepilachna vigintioctopunctata TaxID=420089 RepID=A0AAW1UHT9_9CUCU
MREVAENIPSGNTQIYTYLQNPPIYTISTPSIEHYQRQPSRDSNVEQTSLSSIQTSFRFDRVSSLEPHQDGSLQCITRNQEIENSPLHLSTAQNTSEEVRFSTNNNERNTGYHEENNSEMNLHHPAIIPIDTILQQHINSQDSKSESFLFMASDFTSSFIGPPPLYEENPCEIINSYEPPPHYTVINEGRPSMDSILINPQYFIDESDSFHVKASRFLLLALTVILLIYIIRLFK